MLFHLKLWDLKGLLEGKSSRRTDLQSLAAVNAHDKDINSVAISPNESLVCTTSQDRTAKVWPFCQLRPADTNMLAGMRIPVSSQLTEKGWRHHVGVAGSSCKSHQEPFKAFHHTRNVA